MNIYIHWLCHSDIINHPNMVSDYQIDSIYHGAVVSGYKILSNLYPWWLYKNQTDIENYNKIWGKGFTLYNLLESEPDKYHISDVDCIIIGIHHTANHQDDYLNSTIQQFKQEFPNIPIFIVDGWDQPHISMRAVELSNYYFKRELPEHIEHIKIKPISFAIPEQYIVNQIPIKIKTFAESIPAMHSWGDHPHLKTYKYTNQIDYYNDYRESYFAYTCCKAGWDCMRHYEILANGCIPWFTDIEKCPRTILTNFPKELCIEAKKLPGVKPGTTIPYNPLQSTYLGDTRMIKPSKDRGLIDDNFSESKYLDLTNKLLKYTKNNLTTSKLIEYIINHI